MDSPSGGLLDVQPAGEAQSQQDALDASLKDAADLGRVLFGERSSPFSVHRAKRIIQSDTDWNKVICAHLQNTLEDVVSTGEGSNIAAILRKRLLGTEPKRAMMRAALSDAQYRALEDLISTLPLKS